MADIRAVTDGFAVAPQLDAPDFAAAAAEGLTMLINNRPDGESPDQIPSVEAARLAREAGLAYIHIPVAGAFPADAVAAMAQAVNTASGPVLAYCRSGTRSITLWALAQARSGAEVEALIVQASRAGYDLRSMRPALNAAHGA